MNYGTGVLYSADIQKIAFFPILFFWGERNDSKEWTQGLRHAILLPNYEAHSQHLCSLLIILNLLFEGSIKY